MHMRPALPALFALLAVACSSDPAGPPTTTDGGHEDGPGIETDGSDATGSMPDAIPDGMSPDATVGEDASPVDAADGSSLDVNTCHPGQVWKSSSARIEIRSYGFWVGSSGYEQDRANLSGTQLTALDRLCLIPTPPGISADAVSYVIRVVDNDGSSLSYRAADGNMVDSDEGANGSLPTVEIASLRPLLATFACLSSRRSPPTPPPPPSDGGDAGAPWSAVPTLGSDSGCLNGVFVSPCAKIWLKFIVSAPASYTMETLRCIGTTTLRVFTGDGSQELVAGAPGSSPDCPTVSYGFEQVGTYLIQLDNASTAACEAGTNGPAGDMFVRVIRTN